MSNIILFHFEQSEVRYVGDGITHEWVAQDVCNVLGIKNVSQALDGFSVNQKGVSTVYSRSENGTEQARDVLTIKESGLYRLIFKSRKPVAERFQDWLANEVLPSIQKTGTYSIDQEKTKLERQFLPTPTAKSLKEFHGLHKLMHGKPYADRWLAAKIKEYYPEQVGIAPTPEELPSLPSKTLLTPTEIAQEIGVFCKSNAEKGDARWVNKKLEELGYQEKINGQWSATDKTISANLCDRKPVDTNSRTQKDQLLWTTDVLSILKEHLLSAT
jgi:prophage antirepressor-like protein